jgi:DNA-binding PadR family transcriptional regulator
VERASKAGGSREPRDLLPLRPAVLHILLALADKERHGYGIMREVEERTGGRTRLGPGTLYGSIKRMLADGLIEESDERPDLAMDDHRRRYYRITDFGRRVAGAETERLSGLVETARQEAVARWRAFRARGRLMSRSESAYRILLLAYPREFRRDCGAGMVQAFGDLCREERAS